MADLIPDGLYKILNVKYPKIAVDHLNANIAPYAAIGGHGSGNTDHQRWNVKNLGNNKVILESRTAPGYFASASTYAYNVPIAGSPNPTEWTVRKVAEGQFEFVTEDGKYSWFLPLSGDFVTILLQPVSGATDASYWTVEVQS